MAETVFRRPGWIAAHLFNPLVKGLARLGLPLAGAHTLAVRGRKSGEVRTTPVNPFELDGRTYLLAPRGTTHWVRNLRAAGEGELRAGRRSQRFRAAEAADDQKIPLLRLYLDRWAWEAKDFLEVEADAPDERLREIAPLHPAFVLSFED
jgi:deazaflavin-dependent oxidoreductase (nitroreductase family)